MSDAPRQDDGRRTLRPGRLGPWDGLGIVTVARSADGRAYDVNGTWRPQGNDVDVGALRDAFRAGAAMRYEGSVYDPADASEGPRSFDVIVTSFGEYEDHDGQRLYLVNFDVPGIA